MTEFIDFPAETPSKACAVCGEPMKHLADLRRIGVLSANRIFRCYRCNNVCNDALGITDLGPSADNAN
jgi:transposase